MGGFGKHGDGDDDDNVDDDNYFLNYLNLSNPDFAEPPALALPPPPPSPPPTDDFDMSLLDKMDSTLLWEINNEINAPLPVEGSLPLVAVNAGDSGCGGDNPEDLMAMTPAWVPATHLDCSFCHVLREVVHSDGQKHMKLALHGGLGVFYHAILDIYYIDVEQYVPAIQQSYIDLSAQNVEWVKQFLLDYGLLRFRERYVIMQDSISAFYDALCVSMSYEEEKANTIINQTSMPDPGLCQSRPTDLGCSNRAAQPTTGIATQRERTRRLHLKDLVNYVHLPITEAAKELQICPTALKKVCRKHGMLRWPYRKIKSLDRAIEIMRRELRCSGSSEGASKIQARIDKLMAQRARICAGLPP